MSLGRALVGVSIVVFAIIGLGYLFAPGTMLSVVGISSTATVEFLMRTEGVALLAGAGFLAATTDARPTRQWIVLSSLAAYYFLSSIVDLLAFNDEIVGSLAVPSIAIRIAVGALCVLAAARSTRSVSG